eukprot:g4248.t1
MHLYPKRALLEGFETEIFKLLSFQATPEQWSEWLRAPLEHAATRGNLDLVKRLLKAGANGGAGWRGCRGRTLLDAAALGGNPDVVAALLQAGCRPDAKVVSVSSMRSALHVAIVSGEAKVAKKLILAGVNVKYIDPVDQCSPLHVAAAGAHADIAADLLISGASPHVGDTLGRKPLHVAAEMGHAKVVSVLLESSARVDALDRCAVSALMLASRNGHLSAAKILLAAGATVGDRDDSSRSALDYAAWKGHVSVVNAILEHGADVKEFDGAAWTALHWAVNSNQATVVDAILDAGADVNAGRPAPLFFAATGNNSEVLAALLGRGADVNKTMRRGHTPLHRACRFRKEGLGTAVDLLLRWGASETAVNDEGETPADMFEKGRHPRPNSCSDAELERARILLARAPADRAWRRRCWLVMLRSRTEKERSGRPGADSSSTSSSSTSTRTEGGGDRNKVGRTDTADRWGPGGRGAGRAGAEEGEAAAGDSLSGWVAALLGLESEGLFRAIVGFL